ncbi:MAG: hypothetical protein LAT83_11625 [Kiritimatiellae bacterium]|nr:hypothetical protein [Kiritimatiellia bacterium]
MNKYHILFLALVSQIVTVWSEPFVGITLSSTTLETLVDSQGEFLVDEFNQSDFVFQIGTFATGFSPDNTNTEFWISNWILFGEANYNDVPPPVIGFEGGMTEEGYSVSPEAAQEFDFSGLPAYLWVYNNNNITNEGAEWFLGRSETWVFPNISADPDCDNCGTEEPLQWAMSDLVSSDVPIWGGQSLIEGFGQKFTEDSFTLQTFIIPEPASLVFMVLALAATGLTFYRSKGKRS